MRDTASPRYHTAEGGFTLVEICIALVVMMVAGIAAAGLFSWAIKYNAGAADRAIALSIGQQRMERLRKSSSSDAALAAGTTTETITRSGRPYEVKTTVCADPTCGGTSTLKLITLEVKALAQDSQWGSLPVTLVTRRTTTAVGSYYK